MYTAVPGILWGLRTGELLGAMETVVKASSKPCSLGAGRVGGPSG